MLSHESLINYYKTNFHLKHHHKYTISELDDMIPFEKEIYISLLMSELEKERNRLNGSAN